MHIQPISVHKYSIILTIVEFDRYKYCNLQQTLSSSYADFATYKFERLKFANIQLTLAIYPYFYTFLFLLFTLDNMLLNTII